MCNVHPYTTHFLPRKFVANKHVSRTRALLAILISETGRTHKNVHQKLINCMGENAWQTRFKPLNYFQGFAGISRCAERSGSEFVFPYSSGYLPCSSSIGQISHLLSTLFMFSYHTASRPLTILPIRSIHPYRKKTSSMLLLFRMPQ